MINYSLKTSKYKMIYFTQIGGNEESKQLLDAKNFVDGLPDSTSLFTFIKIRNYYYDLDENEKPIFAEYVFEKFFKKK